MHCGSADPWIAARGPGARMSAKPTYDWPFYCEENVWHAIAALGPDSDPAWAIFVSNPAGGVAMWEQRIAAPDSPVVWDYHVVLGVDPGREWKVLDVDCRLGPWLPAGRWLAASFRPLPRNLRHFAPCFRLVPAETYRRELRSDRSHMRRGTRWLRKPPPWPPIGDGTNLMRFVDVQRDFLGEVLDLEGLRRRLRG